MGAITMTGGNETRHRVPKSLRKPRLCRVATPDTRNDIRPDGKKVNGRGGKTCRVIAHGLGVH